MAQPSDQILTTNIADEPQNIPVDRERAMERRAAISRASNTMHDYINGDCERGYIDEDTRDLLHEALHHVVMAIDSYNTTWHIENHGVSYPNIDSEQNDWGYWDIQITAPFNQVFLQGDDRSGGYLL